MYALWGTKSLIFRGDENQRGGGVGIKVESIYTFRITSIAHICFSNELGERQLVAEPFCCCLPRLQPEVVHLSHRETDFLGSPLWSLEILHCLSRVVQPTMEISSFNVTGDRKKNDLQIRRVIQVVFLFWR